MNRINQLTAQGIGLQQAYLYARKRIAANGGTTDAPPIG